MEFDDVDVSTSSEIAPEDTVVVSCDGDIPQLKAMLEDLEVYEENGIIFNKLNAAASAVEQAADRSPIFKIMKNELPKHTVDESRTSPMKTKVEKAFKSDRLAGLKLSHTKHHGVIDFIAKFPAVLGIACTPENVQGGFVKVS